MPSARSHRHRSMSWGGSGERRARGALRLRPERRAVTDGRRADELPRPGQGSRSLGRLGSGGGDQPGRRRGDGRARDRPARGVPQAADRRGRARRGRGHHDGVRRCLPGLPGQAVSRLGARRPGRTGPRRRCGRFGTRSTCASGLYSPSSFRARIDAARSQARRRGPRHVRARLLRGRGDHGRREVRLLRPAGHRACLRPRRSRR